MSSTPPNGWCRALGVAPPRLEAVAGHRNANTYALLLVALLERGEPMTLLDVAARFEAAGITERSRALRSLQRCKPGRAPVYREGDLYHLDPHDHELDLWVFRLGLRPPRVARTAPRAVESGPLPGPETPLTPAELDEAWKDASLIGAWSAQRLAIAVLDAHGGPLPPAEVVAAVAGRTPRHGLTQDAAKFKRRGSGIDVLADGRWAIGASAADTVEQTRTAVRKRIVLARRQAGMRSSPAEIAQRHAEWEQRRAAHAAALRAMSRALLVGFPPAHPEGAALLDVGERQISTFVGDELATLRSRVATYDILGAVDVRGLLRALGVDLSERRLAELGPPQKTIQTHQRGRTLKITPTLLVQGSCGIARPFGAEKQLAAYLAKGAWTKLRRRLEADARSLYALYEYGRLHGTVRLRWGSLDELIPVPWVHRDERRIHDLKRTALSLNVPLEIVVGSAPDWIDPWSRSRLASVAQDARGWQTWLLDERGFTIDEADVQRARLRVALH